MSRQRLTTQALVCTVCLGGALLGLGPPANAGGTVIGANMGLARYTSPESSGSIWLLAAPGQSALFVNFQPGLRIGRFVDDERRHQLYADVSLTHATSSGTSLSNVQVMAAYEHAFTASEVAPFANVGIGLLHLGGMSDSFNATVIGAGLGMRRTLPNGHGALRAEVRFDRQLEAKREGFVVLPTMDALGFRLGFDLYLQ